MVLAAGDGQTSSTGSGSSAIRFAQPVSSDGNPGADDGTGLRLRFRTRATALFGFEQRITLMQRLVLLAVLPAAFTVILLGLTMIRQASAIDVPGQPSTSESVAAPGTISPSQAIPDRPVLPAVLAAGALALLSAVVFGWLIARRIVALLGELADSAQMLARKNARLEAASIAKARFLAAATHDLRQPLHALTLFSSMLASSETDPAQRDSVVRIQECVESLDAMFSELLDLSRLESGSMQPDWKDFALDDVFDRVSRDFRMVAEQRGLRLVVRRTDLHVRSDAVMLGRILGNLVGNAVRCTASGGVLVAARRRGDAVRVDVWDTGSGIAPEHQQRVFEEAFRLDTGTGDSARCFGLGLSTVCKLAELLGTSVSLRSRPNRGSVFSFEIPLVGRVSEHVPPIRTPMVALDLTGTRVLVVEDDETILVAFRHLLASWGCDVRTARDPQQSTTAIAQWRAPPDIVVADLRLRDGISGLDVLRELDRLCERADHPAFARLLITGETSPERLREVAATGVPVLFKPVGPELLRQAIAAAGRNVFRRRSSGADLSLFGRAAAMSMSRAAEPASCADAQA